MKKILIFVSRTGGGHISLAEALRDMLADRYDVTLVDPQPSIIHWHYRTVSRHALWMWEAEFKLSDGRRRARAAHAVSSLILAERVARALRQTDPDLVISTYPFLTSEVTFAMRRWKLDRPTRPVELHPRSPALLHERQLQDRVPSDRQFAGGLIAPGARGCGQQCEGHAPGCKCL